MSQNANQLPPRLNTLIPMEDGDGNRCFVNQWDVAARKADGWTVVGRLEQHTSQVKAPIDALDGDKPGGKGQGKVAGKGKVDQTTPPPAQ